MVYRGFKVESVVVADDESGPAMGDALAEVPAKRVEFVVSESVSGFHWEMLGSQAEPGGTLEMIDHVIAVRESLAAAGE